MIRPDILAPSPAPGVMTVLIGGQPAAVALEMHSAHVCAMAPPAGPHPSAPCPKGSSTVLIAGRPALRQFDVSSCGAPITVGCPTVISEARRDAGAKRR